LANQQRAARMAAIPRRSSFRSLQDSAYVEAGSVQRGDKTKEEPCRDRDPRRENKDRRVNPDHCHPPHLLRDDGNPRIPTPVRQQQAYASADDAEQRALGKKLPYDPTASRAERGADRDLALPSCSARE